MPTDNTRLNLGSGGDLMATKDDGTAKHTQALAEYWTGAAAQLIDLTHGLPNSQVASPAPSATTMQNGATANGNGTSLAVAGFATAILNITASVAMSGGTTINFEASVDDTTWVSVMALNVGTSTIASSTTTTGDWALQIAGYKSVRARISAYSAGTITIKGYAIALILPGLQAVVDVNLKTALSGLVDSVDLTGQRATYTGVIALSSFAASPTNIGILVGSGTKTVKVRRIRYLVKATAVGLIAALSANRQSTDDSGGTSTTPTKVSRDTNNASATATLRQYSANPTVGTVVGIVSGVTAIQVPATGGGVYSGLYDLPLGDIGDQALTLRGTSECLGFHLNTVSPPAGTILSIEVTWTEE